MAVSTWRKIVNGQASYVNSAYTSGGATLVVANGAVFTAPASGQNLAIRVDDEIMLVTAISGNNLTVTGAQEGTAAANHSVGAIVYTPFTADCAQQCRQQLDLEITSGVPASPTYAAPIRVAFDPTAFKLYIWTGSAWKSVTLS